MHDIFGSGYLLGVPGFMHDNYRLINLFSHSDPKAQPWGGLKADISEAFRPTFRGCGGRAPAYYYFNKTWPWLGPATAIVLAYVAFGMARHGMASHFWES